MSKLRVIHFTDSAGGNGHLWGKENVIVELMKIQRASGIVEPELVTFTPGLLSTKMQDDGFVVHILGQHHHRFPLESIGVLRSIVNNKLSSIPVLHTHEYKANIIGRALRLCNTPMRKLVATCHGWVDRSPQLDAYFAIDRYVSGLSDIVTVTDPWMISQFPKYMRDNGKLEFIPNGIELIPQTSLNDRLLARKFFAIPTDAVVIGSLGRLTKNKGILDILEAARRTQNNKNIIWAIAGSGDLKQAIIQCGLSNVLFVGYQPSTSYLSMLDVYVQASYFEGLSMSLLEAMRAGLPSIVTRAGATTTAIHHNEEGITYDAGNISALVDAANNYYVNRGLRRIHGVNACLTFMRYFTIEKQYDEFMQVYSK